MKKRILTLGMVLALVAVLVVPSTVLASNTGTQNASTSQATTIEIVGKVADTAVGTITFPAGLPGATISAPYNSVDDTGDPQVLHATTSEPVVRLKNTSAGTLTVVLQITTWGNSVVASEDYELVATTDTTVAVVDDVLSANGQAATVNTAQTIGAGLYKALYLEVVLSALAAKTGASTLSILGES